MNYLKNTNKKNLTINLITISIITFFPMTKNQNVLISSRSFGKINSGAIELLKEKGLNPILNPYGKKLNEDQIIELMNESIGIIAGTENITKKIIDSNPNLKIISRYGIGLDNVDLKAAEENNVLVFNTPETPSLAVAELTIALIFILIKKIRVVDSRLRRDEWKPEIGNTLKGKTVGIIGLGKIGKKVAQFLKIFDAKIIVYDIKPDKEFAKEKDIDIVSLDKVLKNSDIVTVHAPLTDETKYLIDKKRLQMMKKTAFLINTARGGLIHEGDLYNALKEKNIAGAALDVFENEPEVGKLKELENIVITPHIATYNIETRKDMELEAAKNIIKGLGEIKIK